MHMPLKLFICGRSRAARWEASPIHLARGGVDQDLALTHGFVE
jgi:hypothetical protein